MVKGKKEFFVRKFSKIDSRSKHDRPARKYGANAPQEEIDVCLTCEEPDCNGKCEKVRKFREL